MSIKAVRQLWFAEKGSLSHTPPTNMVVAGLSKDTKFVQKDMPVKDDNDRDLEYRTNYKIESKSFQHSIRELQIFSQIYCAQGGADCQVTFEKESATTYGGVYNFDGDRFVGFDFEFLLSKSERSSRMIAEVSLENADALLLQQSSLLNTPRDLTAEGFGGRGIDYSSYQYPRTPIIQLPKGTALLNGSEIKDRKLLIKSISDKLDYDRASFNWVNINFELTTEKAKAQDILDYYTSSRNASLNYQEKMQDGSYMEFDFAQYLFSRIHEFNVGKDQRDMKLTFNVNMPLYDITFDVDNQKVVFNFPDV